MSSEDERIVSMKFDNAQFERGIKTSLDALDSLNKGLKLQGAAKGLSDIGDASSKLNLSRIADGVDSIASRFSALSIIGITALTNIANKAVDTGLRIAKSLTIEPITAGLQEYETQLNAIQTIMANTGLEGKAGLGQVNQALSELNTYADKTIYNFTEMTRNIGTFTAAGVDLKTSTAAIKGIANLAAVSGSNAQQASTAMYQLSQAMATGTVKLMDWNSVVNAGMGGKVFQNALIETAKVHGISVDKMIKDEGSFRETLQNGWLTTSILTETLSKFTGDLSASQLKSMGYTEEQIAGILKMGKTANDAATKVKTATQLMDTLKEAVGSGWTQTWQLIIGDFDEARTMWTNVSNVLGDLISASSNARNKVLGDWKALGGRTAMIEAISNAFYALMAAIKPIKDAFREIFPAATGKQLYDLTVKLRDFAASLKIGSETADKLRRTFAGVFAILGIGWEIVKKVVNLFAGLFSQVTDGAGGFLNVTASLGDFLVNLHEAVKNGDKLANFFNRLGEILAVPIKVLKAIASVIGELFSGVTSMQGIPDAIARRFEPITRIGQIIEKVWSNALGIFERLGRVFKPVADYLMKAFRSLTLAIEETLAKTDYSQVLDTINTGLFAGFVLIIRKFLKNGLSGIDVSGGMFDSIKNVFGGLTNTLTTMQANLKSGTLMKIAGAVALLTVSVVALSLIDSAALTKALTAIAIMFTQLFVAMTIFEKVANSKGFVKMPILAASLILLATAIDILVIAVTVLSHLSWGEMLKGLTGLASILGILVVTTKGLAGNAGGMIATGAGLVILAVAIKTLASAVGDLSKFSWAEMAKGLVGVGTLLAALALYTKFADISAGGVLSGAGLLLLAMGIKVLASAMGDIAGLSWGQIAKGLVGMAGGLVILGVALAALPPSSVLSAGAIFVAATAMTILGAAMAKMGKMKWGEIAKSLVMLGGSLTILAVAMYAMSGALPGAAATLVVAGALRVLAPVLLAFGKMSWGEIAKGLVMLAGVFVVFGAAGLLLAPVAPIMLVLGAAIGLLGAGMLAAGAGVLAFSMALTALSVSGAAASATIIAIISGMVGLLPMIATQLGNALISFAQVIGTAGPAMTAAMVAILTAILDAIRTTAPKIALTLLELLSLMLLTLRKAVPDLIKTGWELLLAFLKGIRDHIGDMVTVAVSIVSNFLTALGKNSQRMLDAGAKMIIDFINNLANTIRQNSAALGEAGGNLASAIIEGMAKGLFAGIGRLVEAAKSVAKSALDAAKHLLGIHSPSTEFYDIGMNSAKGMANGMNEFSGLVAQSAEKVGLDAIKAMTKSVAGLSDLIDGELNTSPVITPVVNMKQVVKSSDEMNRLFTTWSAPDVAASYKQATSISADRQKAAQAAQAAEAANSTVNQQAPTVVQFEQNNYSPKALSPAEIYRQTRNQLSLAKEALNAT